MTDDKDDEGIVPDVAILAAEVVATVLNVPGVGLMLGGATSLGLAKVRRARGREFQGFVKASLEETKASIEELRERLQDNEGLFELLELSTEAAVRSATEERRRYIAEIVARGLTSEERTADQSKKLLFLLNSLTDEEVIWLVFYASRTSPNRIPHEILDRHADTFRRGRGRENGAPQAERDLAALQEGYLRSLQRLGLVQDTGPGGVERVTGLGWLLLRHIGVVNA